MIKKVFVLLLVVSFLYNDTKAAPIFFSFGGEKVSKIADFPDNENFQNVEGRYFDAGIKYKQVSIFFIPLWNYEEQWCGYVSSDKYIDMPKSSLDEFATIAEISLPANIKLPLWDRIGGKLILLVFAIAYYLYTKNKTT